MIKRKKKKPAQHAQSPNLALVKYDHNRDLVPVNQNPPPKTEEKKRRRIRKQLARMNNPLSSQTFFLSHLALLILSLVFLSGLYFVLNKDNYSTKVLSDYDQPVTRKPASFNLELKNPEDESISQSRSVVVSGKTGPKASVVVVVDGVSSLYTGTEADINGDFQLTVGLAKGLNQVEIMAFDREGNRKSISRTIYYTEEQL